MYKSRTGAGGGGVPDRKVDDVGRRRGEDADARLPRGRGATEAGDRRRLRAYVSSDGFVEAGRSEAAVGLDQKFPVVLA